MNYKVLVIGGSKGIGEGIVRVLSQEGNTVTYGARSIPLLKKISGDLTNENYYAGLDVLLSEDNDTHLSLESFFEYGNDKMGGIDIIIYNTGLVDLRSVRDFSSDEINKIVGLNLTGHLRAMKLAINYFKENNKKGLYLYISSHASEEKFPGQGPYVGTKEGANASIISEAKALEDEPFSVASLIVGHVNTLQAYEQIKKIHPGFERVLSKAPDPERFVTKHIIPLLKLDLSSVPPIIDARTLSEENINSALK